MLSLCGHKIGGPVNAGALILRSNVAVDALAPGGGQEKGRRGGTVDVAACVGLATALSLAASERTAVNARVIGFRDELAQALSQLDGCEVTAASARRTPGTVHLTFRGIASDELLFLLDQAGLYASAAASCSSGAVVSSHVLAAMGIAPERARGSLRLSMGAETTRADVEAAIAIITAAHQRLRGVSATGELAD
jgi:cysteine desulfurase